MFTTERERRAIISAVIIMFFLGLAQCGQQAREAKGAEREFPPVPTRPEAGVSAAAFRSNPLVIKVSESVHFDNIIQYGEEIRLTVYGATGEFLFCQLPTVRPYEPVLAVEAWTFHNPEATAVEPDVLGAMNPRPDGLFEYELFGWIGAEDVVITLRGLGAEERNNNAAPYQIVVWCAGVDGEGELVSWNSVALDTGVFPVGRQFLPMVGR